MKKIILFLIYLFLVNISYGYYNDGNVDACCIISTINYKEQLKTTTKKIQKYPNLKKRVDNTVAQIVRLISKNKKFRKNKGKIYTIIINKVIDYVYNHNIQKNTPTYIMLSYFVYNIKDLYEYEKNTKKYLLESTLENIDKNPYVY